MIDPLAINPFTAQTSAQSQHYTDESKQALMSSTDASGETIAKQGKPLQTDIEAARQSRDTVDISDEAKAMLQKSVNEPQQSASRSMDDDDKKQKAKDAEESILAGPSEESEATPESQKAIDKLRKLIKEAEQELQKAMEKLSSAQAQANKATTEQEQAAAQGEVDMAQQQVTNAQQKVQILLNQMMEAEKSMG